MLESCIGQNMDFRGFHGRNAESQTVAERPEEGEEGTHDTTGGLGAKVVRRPMAGWLANWPPERRGVAQ